MKKRLQILVFSSAFSILSACSYPFGVVSWNEEVRLNDGRVIVVEQRKKCETKYICRETWLTVNIPDLGMNNLVWHENLHVMALNVDNGHAFLIAYPPTEREFNQYGRPYPFYIAYEFESGAWRKIRLSDIPRNIYDANMLIDSAPPPGVKNLTLTRKESRELNGSPYHSNDTKRINLKAKW